MRISCPYGRKRSKCAVLHEPFRPAQNIAVRCQPSLGFPAVIAAASRAARARWMAMTGAGIPSDSGRIMNLIIASAAAETCLSVNVIPLASLILRERDRALCVLRVCFSASPNPSERCRGRRDSMATSPATAGVPARAASMSGTSRTPRRVVRRPSYECDLCSRLLSAILGCQCGHAAIVFPSSVGKFLET
jgi:hypothetical protein